ncbi:MAG: bactofilin family protein [Alphaproteobacteria bacterium]
MFSKSKEPEVAPAPQSPASKRVARSTVPSIISGDLVVKGTLVSAGDIQVDGRIEGDIRAGALVVGEKASIEGDIMAEEATIRGHVHGSIRARRIQLCATGRVEGNILHEALSMESGAYFDGNCRHSDNPLAEGADTTMRKPQHEVFERRATTAGSQPAVRSAGTPEMARAAAPGASFTPLKS